MRQASAIPFSKLVYGHYGHQLYSPAERSLIPGSDEEVQEVKLLILDEWLLYPLKESEARDPLELIEARCNIAFRF